MAKAKAMKAGMKAKPARMEKGRKLTRSRKDKMLGGVCGGMAEYFDVDPTLVRVAWVLVTLISMGFGVLGYLAAWILIPEAK